MKKQIILSLFAGAAISAYANNPTPNPPDGYTTTGELYFKSLNMTGAYIYDPLTWDAAGIRDAGYFTYFRPADPSANPPVTADTKTATLYDTTDVAVPLSTDGFELIGNNYAFTLNAGNTLTFAWLAAKTNAILNLDGLGTKLSLTGPTQGYNDSRTLDSSRLNLSNGAAFEMPLNGQIKMWASHITATTNSSIQGGINPWHAGSISLTDSTWTAKGVSMFRYDGNGNFSLTLNNSTATLQANGADGTGFNAAFELFAHNATTANPLSITLNNKSTYSAGKLNEGGYAVVSGGDGFMGWNQTNDLNISININSGSKLVMGAMTMGRENAFKNEKALFKISLSTTNTAERSIAYFGDINATLSTSATATASSYKTSIEVGDNSDFRATGLSLGSIAGATNGTSSLVAGTNTTVYILANNYIGNANIGASVARTGGNTAITFTGDTSRFFTFGTYLGNTGSSGGTNTFSMTNATTADATRNMFNAFDVSLRNSTVANSTQKNEFIIDGNTYIDGRRPLGDDTIGDSSFRFNIATDAAAAGTSEVTLKGKNVRFGYLYQINMGNVASTGGTAKLSIQGSDIKSGANNISVADWLTVRAGGGMNTILEFVADEDGFSFLSANAIDFTGTLALDFTNIGTDAVYSGDLLQFRLTGDAKFADWEAFCNELVNGTSTHLSLTKQDEGDVLEFLFNAANGTLSYTYTLVPEPSTYAAIFGALALAFAAYRRRK